MKNCIDRRIEARILELKRQRDEYNARPGIVGCWDTRHKCAAAELRELEKVQA